MSDEGSTGVALNDKPIGRIYNYAPSDTEAQSAGFPLEAVTNSAFADIRSLAKAHLSYGTSWKNRGGVGAFMMLARKWDRLENAVKKSGYDIFKAVEGDKRAEGIMDDIRDLRRYLLLVEAEVGSNVQEVKK